MTTAYDLENQRFKKLEALAGDHLQIIAGLFAPILIWDGDDALEPDGGRIADGQKLEVMQEINAWLQERVNRL